MNSLIISPQTALRVPNPRKLRVPNSRKLFPKNTTWKFMQIMCNVIDALLLDCCFREGVYDDSSWFSPYLSNIRTNLCIALYCILLYWDVFNCIVLLIYCYVDIIQYNAMHKFVGVLDNPRSLEKRLFALQMSCNSWQGLNIATRHTAQFTQIATTS